VDDSPRLDLIAKKPINRTIDIVAAIFDVARDVQREVDHPTKKRERSRPGGLVVERIAWVGQIREGFSSRNHAPSRHSIGRIERRQAVLSVLMRSV